MVPINKGIELTVTVGTFLLVAKNTSKQFTLQAKKNGQNIRLNLISTIFSLLASISLWRTCLSKVYLIFLKMSETSQHLLY